MDDHALPSNHHRTVWCFERSSGRVLCSFGFFPPFGYGSHLTHPAGHRPSVWQEDVPVVSRTTPSCYGRFARPERCVLRPCRIRTPPVPLSRLSRTTLAPACTLVPHLPHCGPFSSPAPTSRLAHLPVCLRIPYHDMHPEWYDLIQCDAYATIVER